MSDAPELLPPEGAEDGSLHWLVTTATDGTLYTEVTWRCRFESYWSWPNCRMTPAEAWENGYRYHAPARPDDATERARLTAEVARLREALEKINEASWGPPKINDRLDALNTISAICDEALRHD